MDTFPLIQGQKFVGTTVRFPFKEKIETMDTFTLIQGQKIVETTVYIFQIRKRLKLWINWL